MTIDAKYCNGCALCAAECPKNAIYFDSADGFVKAKVDTTLCIDCGKCVKVCKKELKPEAIADASAFAAWSNDLSSRKQSTSGGVAFEIAKYAVQNGYDYMGIEMLASELKASAYITSDLAELEKSRGSKYIPTEMFPAVKRFKESEKLLIIDVPCHIAAYDAYFKNRGTRENVILVDMFCEGPCNSQVLKKNVAELCQKNQRNTSDIQAVSFRSKAHFGWSSNFRIIFNDGTDICQDSKNSDFFRLFFTDACHPEACYKCEYDKLRSFADIRIGDYWGKKFQGNKEGVSAVLAFTERGKALLETLAREQALHVEPTDAKDIFEAQLDKPQRKPRQYKKIIAALQTDKSLSEIYSTTMRSTVLERRIRMKLRRILFGSNIKPLIALARKIRK